MSTPDNQCPHRLPPEHKTFKRFPRLSGNGLNPGNGKPQPIVAEQVECAVEFLEMCRPTRTGRVNSYFLKHAAEAWGQRVGWCHYVSNGALIAAALALDLVRGLCRGDERQ
jgi:hypothetical protein